MSKSAADLISQARKKGEQLLVLHTALLLLLGSWVAGFGVFASWLLGSDLHLCLKQPRASPSAGEVQGLTLTCEGPWGCCTRPPGGTFCGHVMQCHGVGKGWDRPKMFVKVSVGTFTPSTCTQSELLGTAPASLAALALQQCWSAGTQAGMSHLDSANCAPTHSEGWQQLSSARLRGLASC